MIVGTILIGFFIAGGLIATWRELRFKRFSPLEETLIRNALNIRAAHIKSECKENRTNEKVAEQLREIATRFG